MWTQILWYIKQRHNIDWAKKLIRSACHIWKWIFGKFNFSSIKNVFSHLVCVKKKKEHTIHLPIMEHSSTIHLYCKQLGYAFVISVTNRIDKCIVFLEMNWLRHFWCIKYPLPTGHQNHTALFFNYFSFFLILVQYPNHSLISTLSVTDAFNINKAFNIQTWRVRKKESVRTRG